MLAIGVAGLFRARRMHDGVLPCRQFGHQQIPVIVNWGRPVVLRDHEGWPGVQKELFSSTEAVEIFGRYFVEQGL